MPTTGDDGRSAYAGADPFDVLVRANNVVLSNLRRDLAIPELHKQLTQTGLANSAQAYFCDPYTNSYLGPQVCFNHPGARFHPTNASLLYCTVSISIHVFHSSIK